MELRWFQAVSPSYQYQLAYNIYYSTTKEHVFSEGVKFVSLDPMKNSGSILGLTPGDQYFFAVRATCYEGSKNNLSQLPVDTNGFSIYSEGVLLSNISATDMLIPVSDINTFPHYGIVQVGDELIRYSSVDFVTSNLVVATGGRGYYDSNVRSHAVDGYDGYYFENPLVRYFAGFEDDNISIIMEECKFSWPSYPYTLADGYREKTTDILTTDFSENDAATVGFPAYDFAGYHRTDPIDVLTGDCIGSYIGGEQYCADGYGNIGHQVRGLSANNANNQRQEVLLSTTGESCVLFKRMWTGKTCRCMDSSRETPEPRCTNCFGTGIVNGFQQYFNPRRSDSRIVIRFDPSVEDLVPQDAGLESTFSPNSWTLTVPAIKDRDFIIRFKDDQITEEYRYEVLNVTRNKMFLDAYGAQKMSLARIRKTDQLYQVRPFRNTATMPQSITTTIGMLDGPNHIGLPHLHTLVISENITSLSQISQESGVSLGHSHTIINGVVQPSLGHTHNIILP
jgi:hypothetical protein